jgi:Tol biopolymer transport system component
LDFVYQARVGDGAPDASGDRVPDIGVFASVDGQVQRVDEAAPGTRHKHPTWTSDGSQVAFVAEGEWDAQGAVVRGSEVWVVDPTGKNADALITCDCWDLNNPAWSPDGTQVAYVEYDAPGAAPQPAASRIVVLDLASKQRTVVVESEPGQLVDIPRWSPDAASLVVSIDRFDDTGNETGSSFGIVPSAGGGALAPMLPFEEYGYAADWNWATGALVFSVEAQQYALSDPRVSPWDLFEIQPDGTGRRTITDVGEEQRLSLPKWSPDGALIAASLDTTPGAPGGGVAAVVDPVTGLITRLGDTVGEYVGLRPNG